MKRLVVSISVLLAIMGIFYGIHYSSPVKHPAKTVTTSTVEPSIPKPPAVVLNDSRIVAIVNEYRARAGVPPLTESAALDATAQAKCDQMLRDKLYGHIDATGEENGLNSIPSAVPSATLWAENLEVGNYGNEAEAVGGWYDEVGTSETGHRTAILNSQYTLTGVAHCWTPRTYAYAHQQFDVVEHFAN